MSEKQLKRERILSGTGTAVMQGQLHRKFLASSLIETPKEQARQAQKANIQNLIRLRQSKHKVLKLNNKYIKTRNNAIPCPASQTKASSGQKQLRNLQSPNEPSPQQNTDFTVRNF